jgi:surface polysaccharide O-acyltransferase-like enzyme
MEYALFAWLSLGIVYPFLMRYRPFSLLRGIVAQYAIVFVYSAIGFFVLGYYFYRYSIGTKSTYIIYLLAIAGLLATISGTVYSSLSSGSVKSSLMEGLSPNVAAMAAGLFLFIKNSYNKAKADQSFKAKMIKYISKGSFCIYLVHVFFIIALKHLGFLTAMSGTAYSIPLLVLIVLVLSLGVYYTLSKIPFANKYLI